MIETEQTEQIKCPLCKASSARVQVGETDTWEIRCDACQPCRASIQVLNNWSGKVSDQDTALMEALHNKLKERSASETPYSVPGQLLTRQNWRAIAGSGVSE